MTKTAVVLFNLGGPDAPDAVQPFLFNLFNDKAIIDAPGPVRWCLAKLISARRAPVARAIYGELGGGSPILANTERQAKALEAVLGEGYRAFIAMRYWQPRSDEAAAAVKQWGAERIVLLPLYPQFSSTTTASSLADWRKAAARSGLDAPSTAVCCYPTEPGFIAAEAERIAPMLAEVRSKRAMRVLFSAHGLPKRVVERGDPYQWQVEQTASAIAQALKLDPEEWVVCYQSRVGPLEWIGPDTSAEIERAGHDNVGVVVVPIAFVSEHSETLVELDIEYRKLAERADVPVYLRAPTVDDESAFIAGLAQLVHAAEQRSSGVTSAAGDRICPAACGLCPLAGA
jgi:ferrochelatase